MVQPPNDHISIFREAGKTGLYEALVMQLQKDFGRANVKMSISPSHPPEAIFATLRENIYKLIMERFDDYLNVMYVVDVPEQAFKQIRSSDVVEVAGEVSLLIVQREWQKVQMKLNHGP